MGRLTRNEQTASAGETLLGDEESDDALVARAGRGDRMAASVLIARHSPRVTAVCRRILNERTGAEDAAQETFLKLWERADRYRPQGAGLDAWLVRVATNACLDRLRRRRREASEDAARDVADSGASAVDALAAGDRRRVVEAALAGLPDRQRIAVTLCHYEDMTNIEAAAAMKISVEAIESLLSRARRNLREALTGQREELMEGTP